MRSVEYLLSLSHNMIRYDIRVMLEEQIGRLVSYIHKTIVVVQCSVVQSSSRNKMQSINRSIEKWINEGTNAMQCNACLPKINDLDLCVVCFIGEQKVFWFLWSICS